MQRGLLIAEGKTKQIYAHLSNADLALIVSKDDITAGDGVRRNVIAGKGMISGRTTANNFALLTRAQIANHFVASGEGDDTMVVRRCTMIPLEVVTRRIATGSYLKRHPHIPEGHLFDPLISEFFYKDDANHDPLMSVEELISANISDKETLAIMEQIAKNVFGVLEQSWQAHDVTLVDLKIEFGRTSTGELVVADVIDNDSWRLWQGGTSSNMLDKQIYRNMREVTPEGLERLRQSYLTVMRLTDHWR